MNSPVSRILCTVDLSAGSAGTVRYALELACTTQAEVHILHVCEALSEEAKVAMMMFMQDEKVREAALQSRLQTSADAFRTMIDEVLASMGTERDAAKALIRSRELVEGFPAEIILREAKSKGCDMIVLGAHEHGVNHTFIGTVAKRVMRRADIPTLIVPRRRH